MDKIFEESDYKSDSFMKPKPITYKINKITACWLVTSLAKNKSLGYPRIKRMNRNVLIHRYVWEHLFGKIPKGKVVRHKCDNKMCINPEHLELGTQLDNIKDAILRGQIKSSFSEQDIRDIRKSSSGCRILSRKYNVSESAILSIRNGSTYKHVI